MLNKPKILLLLIPILFLTNIISCNTFTTSKSAPGPQDEVFDVNTQLVEKTEIPNSLSITGVFQPYQKLEIKSPYTGKIEELNVEPGQEVFTGDVLLAIRNEQLPLILEKQQAELREAEARLELELQTGEGVATADALEEYGEEDYEETPRAEEPETEIAENTEPNPQDLEGETGNISDLEGIDPEQLTVDERARLFRARAILTQRQVNRTPNPTPEALSPADTEAIQESKQNLTQATIDRLRAEITLTESQMNEGTLLAPFSGLITEINIANGTLVKEDDVLLNLISIDPIELSLQVPQDQISKLNKSTLVKVTVPDLSSKALKAELSFIGAEVSSGKKTVEIRLRMDNPNTQIKGGMEGMAQIVLKGAKHQALLIPDAAVVEEDNKSFVYVLRGQKAIRQEVELGNYLQGKVEIKKGIRASDQVITGGIEMLKDNEEFVRIRTDQS